MKYIIWHNDYKGQYEFGNEEEFIEVKEKYGKKILLRRTFRNNATKELLQKVTSILNTEISQ